LNGLWIAIGINPETEILKALSDVIKLFANELSFFFWLIPIIMIAGAIFSSYMVGGKLGLWAVLIAFVSGISIVKFTNFGVLLFIIAIVMGFFAPSET